MEIDLMAWEPKCSLPEGFFWREWSDGLIDLHAEVKYLSFRNELDSQVFPILGDRFGCQRLMREIRNKPGFLSRATWLIGCDQGFCATIQGIVDRTGYGFIQNVAVLPGYRGKGLGKALVTKSLAGFKACGLRRAFLEVTADNPAAVLLYYKLGFQKARTSYRAVTHE